MTEKATTPPQVAARSTDASTSPAAKRARMTSPDTTAKESLPSATETREQEQGGESAVPIEAEQHGLPEEYGDLEADDGYSDSGFGTDSSDTTSLASSIFRGIVENGRKYQAVREGEYYAPSDEKQFESYQAAHIVYTLLEANQKNPLFRSPIRGEAQNILDVGTGAGEWARQVADMFPHVFVQGVDLAPPPDPWVPPNCRFEVDDVLKPWEWPQLFDMIHMRDLFGAFTDEQWRLLYKQAYKNLLPGGWIEQAETGIRWTSDDGSVTPDSALGQWGPVCGRAMERLGKNVNTVDVFKAGIEAAGFTNVHEKVYKVPVGDWAKNPLMKEVGKYHKSQIMEGLEGYIMFVMTKFGEPEPWSPAEVQVFLAKVRKEMADPKIHPYIVKRRVWAQKPLHG